MDDATGIHDLTTPRLTRAHTHKHAHTHAQVWQSLFSIRQLVVPMHEDVDGWLKFASLCRKSGRVRQAHRMLLQLLRCVHSCVHTHTRAHTQNSRSV